MTRQRRGACQPGATPREHARGAFSALQGRRIPAPWQGAPIDSETQGVALGLRAAALSAPESNLCKSEFTSFDDCPLMRCLLVPPVVLVISVACVGNGETAIGPGRDLNGIHRSFIWDARGGCAANPQIGNKLLGGIVVSGVNRVVQLPQIFQTRRFLQRLERSNRPTFFCAVIHYG